MKEKNNIQMFKNLFLYLYSKSERKRLKFKGNKDSNKSDEHK